MTTEELIQGRRRRRARVSARQRHPLLCALLHRLYAVNHHLWRKTILRIAAHVDGGAVTSQVMRRILQDYHGVEIGLYSYGGCFDPSCIAPLTKIGRYCSFANGVVILNANHPLAWKSTHPFFFNPQLGYVAEELITRRTLTIGNDVWVGHGALILPGVSRIGDGAVIGAGAVVTKDVPDFAIVAGNPARIIRSRFPEDICRAIQASRWWEREVHELDFREFTQPCVGGDRDGSRAAPGPAASREPSRSPAASSP